MSNYGNYVISAESDKDQFEQLNVQNIVITPTTTTNAKYAYANIKYLYSDNKKKMLKIQTSDLFSSGITKYNNEGAPKMAFTLIDKALREKENPTEEDLIDISVEDGTIEILDSITKRIQDMIKEPEMVKLLGKNRDKKWDNKVDDMEIVKRFTRDDGSVSVNMWAKVITQQNFMKTKFYLLSENGEAEIIEQQEIIDKLIGDTKCRATAILVIDSVFIGEKPSIQVKVGEVVISKLIEPSKRQTIIMPARFRNKINAHNEEEDVSDSDVSVIKKVIIDSDSDSD